MKYMKEIKLAEEIRNELFINRPLIFETKIKGIRGIRFSHYSDSFMYKKGDMWYWGIIVEDNNKIKLAQENSNYYSFKQCLKQVYRNIQLADLITVFEDYA
jgi:hypothetical protein